MDIALEKGLRILDLLARAGGPLGVSAIAEELGLVKSGVHRVLTTLCELGYVQHEPETRRYRATLKVWEQGSAVISAHPAKRAAAPYLQELHRATHETVNLLVRDGDDVLYLDKILSPRPLRFTTQPGSRAPAPLTASGLVILATEPDAKDVVARVVKREAKAKELGAKRLLAEIDLAGRRGFAISQSRWTPGIMGIAAAIPGRNGRAVGALAISGTVDRIGGKRRQEIIDAVMVASARVAETAGGL